MHKLISISGGASLAKDYDEDEDYDEGIDEEDFDDDPAGQSRDQRQRESFNA